MKLTSNYGLKKPEGTDPVDVQDFNDNADKLDAELKKRPESDGDASDMTVGFTEATQLTELTSNDSLGNLFGKLKLAVKNVISLLKLLGSTDISAIGDGTCTGAISELNTNLSKIDVLKIIAISSTYVNKLEVVPGTNVSLSGGGIYIVSVILGSIDPANISQIAIISNNETALNSRYCNHGNAATFLLTPNTDCEICLYLATVSTTITSGDFRLDSFSVVRIK